jgi:hypothetical protein
MSCLLNWARSGDAATRAVAEPALHNGLPMTDMRLSDTGGEL